MKDVPFSNSPLNGDPEELVYLRYKLWNYKYIFLFLVLLGLIFVSVPKMFEKPTWDVVIFFMVVLSTFVLMVAILGFSKVYIGKYYVRMKTPFRSVNLYYTDIIRFGVYGLGECLDSITIKDRNKIYIWGSKYIYLATTTDWRNWMFYPAHDFITIQYRKELFEQIYQRMAQFHSDPKSMQQLY